MSMDTDIFAKSGVEYTDTDEKARRAVKAFRALQPTLSAYARVLTKRPGARVEMAARDNGSTDGNRIFFRPPIELGSDVPHERKLCDKRDEKMQPSCPACAIREGVLVTIYHEIAHICFESFAQTSEHEKAKAIQQALKAAKGPYADLMRKRVESAPDYIKESYIGLASLINEFLPIIFNALEDARVNRELFKARKGTKVMFDADTWKVFTEGVEQKDEHGEIVVKKWDTYPLNMQVIVGLFCKASGYDFEKWFVPQVVEALNDEQLSGLVRRLDTARTAKAVYQLSFPVLQRLRELGFCGTPEDPDQTDNEEQDDGTGQGEPDSSATSEGESDEQSNEADPEGSGPNESDEPSDGSDGQDTGEGAASGDAGQPDESADRPEPGEVGDEQDGETDSSVPEGDGGSSSSGDSDADRQDHDDQGKSGVPESEDGSSGESGADSDSADKPDEASSQSTSGDSDGDESNEGSVDDSTQRDSTSPAPEQGNSGEQGDPSDGNEAGQADDSDGSTEAESPGDTDLDSGKSVSEASSESSDVGPDRSDVDASSPDPGDSDTAGTSDSAEGGADGVGRPTPEPDVEAPEEGDLESRTQPERSSDSDGEDQPIDSGADDGQGGTRLIEHEEYDDLPMGDPEEVKLALLKWGDHEEKPKTVEEQQAEESIDRAIIQGIYFETPSRNIYGVREHRWGDPVIVENTNMSAAWNHSAYLRMGLSKKELGIDGDFSTPESVLGPALMRMRVAFADNERGAELRHRRAGRVDGRVLGKRAPLADDRLFKKKVLPGKKNYFVLIGVDISGSTVGVNIQLEKKAVFAQAQLLHRMGIDFAIYAHSGNYHSPTGGRGYGLDLDMYVVKERGDVWDSKAHEKLFALGPDSANLDGHSLEYYRKRLDEQVATDKIILYYTDGKMPAENHDEELEILQREIRLCRKKGYTLLGVGIRTDSPIRHGLDTVQVDEEADVVKVVKHLEKRLLAG